MIKKTILFLMAAVMLAACEPAEANSNGPLAENKEARVNAFFVGQHKYEAIYVTCTGRRGHPIDGCEEVHCRIVHSLECACRKAPETPGGEEEEENNDYNW